MRTFSLSRLPRARFSRSLVAGLLLAAGTLLVHPGPARALDTPSSGSWKFALYANTWGGGSSIASGNLSSSTNIGWSALTSFNDMASSYSICNYTGSAHTFTIELYKNYNYDTIIESDTVTVGNGQCRVHNITDNDMTSSAKVLW